MCFKSPISSIRLRDVFLHINFVLFNVHSGKSTNFVHQHFYDANQSKQPKKSASAAARRTAASTTYWGAITAYLQGCCSGGGGQSNSSQSCCKSCSCSFSWCKCCRCCGWGSTASNSDSLHDSGGTNFDDATDLEAGLSERTPLIDTSSKKSYTAVGNTTTTTLNTATSATSTGNVAEDGLIRDRAASTGSQDQEQDQDDILDLEAGPQADQGADNNEKESSKPDKKRKKKPLSMYDNARLALGLVPSKIEHAQEVQLFTSDQQPAGKVRHLFWFFHHHQLRKVCCRWYFFRFDTVFFDF